MKPYSTDLREKIVSAYLRGDTSVRKVAAEFNVAPSFVQKLLSLKKTQGHLEPKKQGGTMKGKLDGYESELKAMVEKYPDWTLSEYCEYWGEHHHLWVSTSVMCRQMQKLELTRKKNLYIVAKPKHKQSKIRELNTGNK